MPAGICIKIRDRPLITGNGGGGYKTGGGQVKF